MLKRILLGLSDLPGYGGHPGTVWMAYFTVLGLFVTAPSWRRMLLGQIMLWSTLGYMFLRGAYERGDAYLREREKSP